MLNLKTINKNPTLLFNNYLAMAMNEVFGVNSGALKDNDRRQNKLSERIKLVLVDFSLFPVG